MPSIVDQNHQRFDPPPPAGYRRPSVDVLLLARTADRRGLSIPAAAALFGVDPAEAVAALAALQADVQALNDAGPPNPSGKPARRGYRGRARKGK